MKPLISDKSLLRDRINLMVKEQIVKSESKIVEILNKFFLNIV